MSYHFTTQLDLSFDEAIQRVTEALKQEGFGVMTEIDVKATLKKKIGADFRNYRILGACNPHYAHEALTKEPIIGTMLPCNVVVQDPPDGSSGVLVSAIDPVASMQAIENQELGATAVQVREKLRKVVESLNPTVVGG